MTRGDYFYNTEKKEFPTQYWVTFKTHEEAQRAHNLLASREDRDTTPLFYRNYDRNYAGCAYDSGPGNQNQNSPKGVLISYKWVDQDMSQIIRDFFVANNLQPEEIYSK